MLTIKNLNLPNPSNPKEILVKDINLSLDSKSKSKVALIGENGSGKSTLLREIVKNQNSSIQCQHEKVMYLEQSKKFPKQKLVGEILEAYIDIHTEYYKLEIVLQELQLSEDILIQTTDNLSGGETLKIQLAELLLQDPTILLLDEPTNHLDQQTKNFLSKFIQDFDGSVLLVTHDRHFIQETINIIWDIDPATKTISTFTGSYQTWREQKLKSIQKTQTQHQKLKSQIKQIESWLQSNQNHPKYKFSAIVQTKKQKLTKLKSEFSTIKVHKNQAIKLSQSSNNKFKQNLLISYDFKNHPLYGNLTGKIYNQDQILLDGPNGSGKSTLLKYLLSPDNSESIYPINSSNTQINIQHNKCLKISTLSQSSNLPSSKTVQEILLNHIQGDHTKVFQSMAQLNLKQLLKQKFSQLSGGQQKRVELAILNAQNPDIIFLDEPTNHLDVYTQEQIQNFLQNTNITFILISHDKILKSDIVFSQKISL
jgi:ATPase subunit of ABC transporter with duplicated ATPase domains